MGARCPRRVAPPLDLDVANGATLLADLRAAQSRAVAAGLACIRTEAQFRAIETLWVGADLGVSEEWVDEA